MAETIPVIKITDPLTFFVRDGERRLRWSVALGKSRSGRFPEPVVMLEHGASGRAAQAAVLRLGAELELASQDEQWCVCIERGYIRLELADATDEEAQRAMGVLRSVLARMAVESRA